MSKIRRDLDYLSDLQEAIDRAIQYTRNLTWEEYLEDRKTQDAVIRNLEIIGEAAKLISDEFRLRYPDLPWREMSGTRDRLIHQYFGVNQDIVWEIIQIDLPKLKQQIATLVRELPSKD